jgi:tetratricopeptide (TPR) repeat protein
MSFPASVSGLSDFMTSSEQYVSLEDLLFPVGMKDRDLLRRSSQADFFLVIAAEIAGKSEEDIHICFDQHISQLNLEFANWLNNWGKARFATGERHQEIEMIIDYLGAVWNFPRGNRAANLEIAMVASQLQLLFIIREVDPQSWARTQNNLAIAYSDRIKGDRAENLEVAIAYFTSSLEIRTKNNLPKEWAKTQTNLSAVYSERIHGDRAENLEVAINCLNLALKVITKDYLPKEWSAVQNNLAVVYRNRIRGDRAENLEAAIAYFTSALEIRTKNNLPKEWARTLNNLANAYCNRIRGDRAENLETAIRCYESALEVRTKNNLPMPWAMTQSNLAEAYGKRIRGDKSENLKTAIKCYENALLIIASSGFPQQLDDIKNSLANAYIQRVSFGSTDIESLNQTNDFLQQLVQTCLEQDDWYKASLSLDLWSTALASQQNPTEAVQPLLQVIGLDIQHNPQLIDTDLQELAKLISQLDWQPSELLPKWQAAREAFSFPMPPLNPELQAKICLTIGVVSIQEKYWFKGLDWLKASWEIYQNSDDLRGLAEVSYQLAIGHHIASNLSYAGIYYRDAQRLFQHLKDIRKAAFCHHGLGRLLLQMGKIQPAIAEFDHALAIYRTIPDSPQVADKISDIQYYQRIITDMQNPARTHQLI